MKDLTFDEGPFFLIEATVYPYMGKRVVIWATDETTAMNVFSFKLNLPTAYCVISHLGDLNNTKTTLHLSPAQVTNLHHEGYLRLTK